MKLQIAEGRNEEFDTECFRLQPHMLSLGSTHMFIASNKWDSIELNITPELRADMLKYMHTVTDSIKVTLPVDISSNTLEVLTSLFPERAGKLRKAFMCGNDVREVLADCLIVS